MIASIVYILCALTSAACAIMLLRGYLRSRSRFLMWSCLCFSMFFIHNLLLMIDNLVIPERIFFPMALRSAISLVGLLLLIYGLIFDTE
jgi:hypothetical protein